MKEGYYMDKKNFHSLVEKEQPNICQIVVLKDGKEVYADEWNDYKKVIAFMLCQLQKVLYHY